MNFEDIENKSIDNFNKNHHHLDAFCFDIIKYDECEKEVKSIWILRQYIGKTISKIQNEFNNGKKNIYLVHQEFDKENSYMVKNHTNISLLKKLSDENNNKFIIRPNMVWIPEKKKNYQRFKKFDSESEKWLSFPEWKEKNKLESESGYSEFYNTETIHLDINYEATEKLKQIIKLGSQSVKKNISKDTLKHLYEERQIVQERLNILDKIIKNHERNALVL